MTSSGAMTPSSARRGPCPGGMAGTRPATTKIFGVSGGKAQPCPTVGQLSGSHSLLPEWQTALWCVKYPPSPARALAKPIRAHSFVGFAFGSGCGVHPGTLWAALLFGSPCIFFFFLFLQSPFASQLLDHPEGFLALELTIAPTESAMGTAALLKGQLNLSFN